MAALGDWFEIRYILILVALVITFFTLPYTLGPILTYFTEKISGHPQLEEFTLSEEDIPKVVKRYLFPTIQHLEEVGFKQLGAYYLRGYVTNVRHFVVLMGNKTVHDVAVLAVTFVHKLEGSRLSDRHVEFSARLDDGTEVDTSNTELVYPFYLPKGYRYTSLPWIKNVRQLHKIHRALIQHYYPGRSCTWGLDNRDPGDYLEEVLATDPARHIKTGYMYQDSSGDFRPTIKGAILTTYKRLWPIKPMLRSYRRRSAERLLRELKF